MAHVLTTGEKTTQRKKKQWSKTFLAIPEYHTIYTARLDGVPASNDMVAEINFDTGTGLLSSVLPDMTLYVSAVGFGKYDLGMCRIRKDSISGVFYVGETSEVVWQNAAYLTVVDDYSLWQKSIRLVAGVPYMDWDVAYSDQHEDFDPVPCMGTHRVAKLTGVTVSVTLGPADDTSAWVIGSTIASVLWVVGGASLDDDTAINPVMTVGVTGTYVAYCTFTAVNGKTFKGVRYVIVYDDAHPLLKNFSVGNGSGNFDGGYSFDVTLFSNFDVSVLRKRSLVILCTEDYAGISPITLPGQIAGAENILCVGRIADIDNRRTSEFGEISFNVQSDEYWMRQIRDYPTGLELQTDATGAWIAMPSLNVPRAMWHFLHWRSTATRVMDIQHPNDGRISSRFNIARANLWERLIQITQPVIFAAPHVDNFGRLFVFIEPQMVPEASRTWPVVMELLDTDIEDDIAWVRRDVTALSMLFLSGINVDSSGAASSYFSMSPGHSYAHHGEEDSQDNYLVADQTDSNALCGLYYGWKNNPLDNLEISFAHSMRILGLAPRQFYYYQLSAANDPRGIGYAGNLIPRDVSFSVNQETGFISISATFEPESFAGPAINGDVPTMETVDFSTPNIHFPPILPVLPVVTLLPPTTENLTIPSKIIIASSNFGVMYTTNANETDISKIVWKSMNSGLDTFSQQTIGEIMVTPSGKIYMMCFGDRWGFEKIMIADVLGGAWRTLLSNTDYPDAGSFIYGLGVNPLEDDSIAVWGGVPWNFGPTEYYQFGIGGSGGITFHSPQANYREGFATVLFSDGKWNVFGNNMGNQSLTKFTAGGGFTSFLTSLIGTAGGSSSFGCVAGTQDLMWYWCSSFGQDAVNVTNGGTVYTSQSMRPDHNGEHITQGISASPTGTFLMGCYATTPKLSTDGGASWNVTSLTIGPRVWENCRDENRWLFGGGANIRVTLDRGATSTYLMGNMVTIASLIDITHIRYVGE